MDAEAIKIAFARCAEDDGGERSTVEFFAVAHVALGCPSVFFYA